VGDARSLQNSMPGKFEHLRFVLLAGILAVAGILRGYELGRSSFWYDEVVTMRLARSADPPSLLKLLGRIDATRAPLHPLVLWVWVEAFGASETSGRSFSVLCGVLTVALVYHLGLRAFADPRAALWGAWLAALSPPLLQYSREARMYALLVLLTCAAWDALLSLRGSPTAGRLVLYAASLAALGYTHPLGLFMAGSLGLAALVNRRTLGLSWGLWVVVHLVAGLSVAPWLGRYLDHPPEFLQGRLPLRYLIGTPIGFVGGNFITLAAFSALILYALIRFDRRDDGRLQLVPEDPVSGSCLLTWLMLPPVILYLYSRVSHPIFGPSRYTLFVAPAYLLLVARGLSKSPVWAGAVLGSGATCLSVASWGGMVYDHDLKADWRAAAAALGRLDPAGRDPVVVISRGDNVEVETARYYLGPRRPILPMPVRLDEIAARLDRRVTRVWFSVAVRHGRPFSAFAPGLPLHARWVDVDGLRLIPVDARDLPTDPSWTPSQKP